MVYEHPHGQWFVIDRPVLYRIRADIKICYEDHVRTDQVIPTMVCYALISQSFPCLSGFTLFLTPFYDGAKA